jgi:lysyl-tRNA synthetase class 2
MKDTEQLFEFLAIQLFGKPSFQYQGKEISVQTPWPRLRVRDLFLKYTGIDLVRSHRLDEMKNECARLKIQTSPEDTWDDLYFRVWLNLIEPKLPTDQAVFVMRYPASQAALAVVDQDPDGSRWARRFELYAGGIELGNAFEELTDPVEQRKRFVEDMELREKTYGSSFPKNPLDEGFLDALSEGMPPSGGIAVGVDRMVMLFANEPDIHYTTWI